ncbi:hypothetical protein FRX31_026301 [Thalictrum thalictroides]|uniref:Uncharacterized protein n=1 Tax=Thalictrum thalictroides TaxID=46969 RepID=A0A7J6VIH9_THATH|nr:hypothetical protein FRX31_026301 [Thalictrum thalictroides]
MEVELKEILNDLEVLKRSLPDSTHSDSIMIKVTSFHLNSLELMPHLCSTVPAHKISNSAYPGINVLRVNFHWVYWVSGARPLKTLQKGLIVQAHSCHI